MKLKITFHHALVGLFASVWTLNTAFAGISLDRTRIIVKGDEKSASANLTNTNSDIPFLAQSWVEDANGKKITEPLLVLPPLQRIDGGQKGVIRVTKTDGINALPQDRESLFYLNVREIPPKPDKPNILQLAMQSRIKLFYRPAGIVPENNEEVWQDQVIYHKQGNKMLAENPTPFYITLIGLTRNITKEGGEKLTDFNGVMIPPKSSINFPLIASNIEHFAVMYVNDYGGHPERLYRCAGDVCKVLPESEQPK
ncbi:molecular chaperone [Buttiauxella noackiae]|uniref:fimbrial biogenesis chaperone n=1 Tax=Buttiauxella noackiae TaxID=82992 RepID=UPI0035A596C6